MKRVYTSLLVLSGLVVACGLADMQSSKQQPVNASGSPALTAAQCDFFDVNGTVRICHATGSAKNPYTILQVSGAGCVDGHAGHPGDYAATASDPNCRGGGCLPAGAPLDPTSVAADGASLVPCCEGLVVQGGICTEVTPVTGLDGG